MHVDSGSSWWVKVLLAAGGVAAGALLVRHFVRRTLNAERDSSRSLTVLARPETVARFWEWTDHPREILGGAVSFAPALAGRATEIRVQFRASPLGAHQVLEHLRRTKMMMEAGEVATTDGQPSGRTS